MYIAIPIVRDAEFYDDELNNISTTVETPKIIIRVDDAAYKHNPAAVMRAIQKRVEDENNRNTSRFKTSISR